MGFLDELKNKAGGLGEKAREGFGAAKDKAADLVGDVRERFESDAGDTAPATDAPDTAADRMDTTTTGDPGSVADVSDDLGALGPNAATETIGDATYFGTSREGLTDLGDNAPVSDTLGEATTGLGDAPSTGLEDTVSDATAETASFEESGSDGGFHADEVSGGLDTPDDALDAVQAETEELRNDPYQP